jgi:hypothetical protein
LTTIDLGYLRESHQAQKKARFAIISDALEGDRLPVITMLIFEGFVALRPSALSFL